MADQHPAGATALIIVDMINRLAFGGGERLREAAERASGPILSLRDQATEAGVPVIYVNDNHGDWHEDRAAIIAKATAEASPGQALSQRLVPRDEDYFVMKPQFSGFYNTNLPAILPRLGVRRLVLTGVATDICVLFTAADAHMREYELWVPANAVGSEEQQRTDWALDIMTKSMKADTRPTTDQKLADWVAKA